LSQSSYILPPVYESARVVWYVLAFTLEKIVKTFNSYDAAYGYPGGGKLRILRLHDAVARAHIMQQKVAIRVDRLIAEFGVHR
jgi:hypothetical protein